MVFPEDSPKVMYLKTLVLLCFALQSAHCQAPDVRDFCKNVLASPLNPCDVAQCQGRPGKRGVEGRQGVLGQKGEKGDRGPSCDILEQRLELLEEKVRENEKTVPFNFCAIGMKNGVIADGSITTSSTLNASTVGQFARLDGQPIHGVSTGAWCTHTDSSDQWIKIDLGKLQAVSGIITQGSPSTDDWVTSYTVSCGNNEGIYGSVKENGVAQVYDANSDRNTKSVIMFAEKVTCRFIRIHPETWHGRACLRLELLRGVCHSPKIYSFYVESAGADDGNTCKILINGVDHAIRSRGHCVVILDTNTGSVTTKTFDTYGYVEKVGSMIDFLEAAPANSLIALAIRDATRPDYISDETVNYLENLGAVGTACPSKIAVRDSWSFITQKVDPGAARPSWVKCQHVPRYGGRATVHTTATFSAHYNSWEDVPLA